MKSFPNFTSIPFDYSRLPITRTFKGNRKKCELSGVRVIGSLKQITGSNEISKCMDAKERQLSNKDFNTRFFFPTCHALVTWFELSRVKFNRNQLKGNKNYLELAGVSNYRGLELPRIKLL